MEEKEWVWRLGEEQEKRIDIVRLLAIHVKMLNVEINIVYKIPEVLWSVKINTVKSYY